MYSFLFRCEVRNAKAIGRSQPCQPTTAADTGAFFKATHVSRCDDSFCSSGSPAPFGEPKALRLFLSPVDLLRPSIFLHSPRHIRNVPRSKVQFAYRCDGE